MALNKRQYVDGQTIVTAANLNEIQDCIIAIEGAYVPKTRKVAGKALSSDITISASDVGAVPTSRTINAKALTGNITLSAADVGAVPVARTVNGKALSSNITLSAADVSAVPTTRTVNSKALSEDISLTASDVGAVPTGRKVNGKALSSDITLAASDVGAVPVARTVNGKALSSNITLSAADVSAVPTTRTVNSKALSADITLASGDIEDDSDAGGATVKASLSLLKGSLNTLQTNLSGDVAVSTEAELLTTTKTIRTTANISLGNTGVTIEAYARGVVISHDGATGCVLAVGYNGNVYAGYFTNSVFVKAQIYNNIGKSITLTANQTYISSTSGIACKRTGNIVTFSGSIVVGASATTNNILLSGFPAPSSAIDIFGTVVDATDKTLRGKSGRYRIKTDGTLVPWYNSWGATEQGSTIAFNTSYII